MAKSFSIIIKGTSWDVELMSEKSFLKKYPEFADAGAICRDEDNKLVFMPEHLSTGVVRHEVLHALVFTHEDFKDDMTALDTEELCCKIVQKEYALWTQLTEQIVDAFLKKKPTKAKEQGETLAKEEANV